MIKAHFIVNAAQQISSFQITGHADSGPYGSDIVCAAVSVSAIGTINNIQRLAGFEPVVEADNENGGLLTCQLPTDVTQSAFDTAQILLKALLLTLQDVTQQYSQYIEVKTSHS